MAPLRVLVVARWYPAFDDPVRGSFVADQVDALVATRRVQPAVASFEFVRLNREPGRAEAERAEVHTRISAVVRGRPDVFADGGSPASEEIWPNLGGVPVARLPVATAAGDSAGQEADEHLRSFLPFLEGLVSRCGGERPFDLVHGHTAFPDGELAAAGARLLGVPYLVTEHSSLVADLLRDPDVHRRYAAVVRDAARVVVVSEALGRTLRAALPELGGILDERLVVAPNAVPVERFTAPGRATRRTGELLYVGSRKPDKGIAVLLEAFALARAERPDLTLRLIGRSPTDEDEASWHTRADELGLTGAVAFEPQADRGAVAEAMSRADVFVHPSRYETFGMVAAEALAAGLPVVATRSGGVEEVLGSDAASRGALVPVDDRDALAAAIVSVFDHRAEFDPGELRAHAARRFASGAVAQRLLALYDEIVGRQDDLARARPERGRRALATSTPASPTDVSRTSRLPVVVCFNRIRAARLLGPLPGALLRDLTLLTVPDPGDQPLPPGLGEIVVADLDAGYRAALDEVRRSAPPRGLRGRIARITDPEAPQRLAARAAEIHARHADYRLETAQAVVADAVRRRSVPDLLCVDGYDLVAASRALDSCLARLTPGGIRWLADRWTAARLERDEQA